MSDPNFPNDPSHNQAPQVNYDQPPQVQYEQAPQVQYEQAPQVAQDDGSIIALICYLVGLALVGVGLLSGFSGLTGIKLKLEGAAIPAGWGFMLVFWATGAFFAGLGWIIDLPVFRRNQWLWLPLLGGLGFGGYGTVYLINVWDAGGWMMYAAKNGHVDKVKSYLKDKSITQKQKETMFRKAVGGGHASVVRALLAAGVDVNLKSTEYDPKKPQNYLMFHWACTKGNVDLVKAFVEKGVKINAKNTDGKTPLHVSMFYYGISSRTRPVVEYLVSKGAKLNLAKVSKYRRRELERQFPKLSSKLLQEDKPVKPRAIIPVRDRVPNDDGLGKKGSKMDDPDGDNVDDEDDLEPRRKVRRKKRNKRKRTRRRRRRDDDEEDGDWLR